MIRLPTATRLVPSRWMTGECTPCGSHMARCSPPPRLPYAPTPCCLATLDICPADRCRTPPSPAAQTSFSRYLDEWEVDVDEDVVLASRRSRSRRMRSSCRVLSVCSGTSCFISPISKDGDASVIPRRPLSPYGTFLRKSPLSRAFSPFSNRERNVQVIVAESGGFEPPIELLVL